MNVKCVVWAKIVNIEEGRVCKSTLLFHLCVFFICPVSESYLTLPLSFLCQILLVHPSRPLGPSLAHLPGPDLARSGGGGSIAAVLADVSQNVSNTSQSSSVRGDRRSHIWVLHPGMGPF